MKPCVSVLCVFTKSAAVIYFHTGIQHVCLRTYEQRFLYCHVLVSTLKWIHMQFH
jgi:hypothetical protein